MKIYIGDNNGHIIIDDDTGTILSVLVRNVIEGKSDGRSFYSHTNHKDGRHTRIKLENE